MNKMITVLDGQLSMLIALDPFFSREVSLSSQKKLLRHVFQESWRNEYAIWTLAVYLPQKQAEAKDKWNTSSRACLDAPNRKKIAEVKRDKADFERWGKLNVYFETLKNKCVF